MTVAWSPPTTRRLGLPAGVAPVAVGMIVSGACAYGFLALSARALGPVRDAPLAAFWSFAFLIGPGCFSTLEKECGRLLSAGAATGDRSGPVMRRGALIAGGLVVLLAAATAGAWSFTVHRLFDGSAVLGVAFLVALATMAGEYLALGVLAGNARFSAYGRLAAGEGAFRLAVAVPVVLAGGAVGWYGVAVAAAPALALLAVGGSLRASSWRGPDHSALAMSRAVAWLLLGTLFSNVLVGGGPLAVQLLAGGGDRALTSRFLSALVLVRVPLFLYNAAAAALLPALAGHAARGEHDRFRAMLERLTLLVAAAGLAFVGLAAAFGPAVLGAVFGPGFRLPGGDLALLAGTAAALLVATTLATALMAVGRLARLAAAWAAGVGLTVVVTVLLRPILLRVEVGFLAGSLLAAGVMAVMLYRSVPAGRVAAAAS